MATRRTYTDEEKDMAARLAGEIGLAAAVAELEIPKSSIKTWAKERNIDVAPPELTAATQKATETSIVNRSARIAAARERMVDAMIEVAEQAAKVELQMLRSGENRLDHVVGARTRAIHDMQLLDDKPTDIYADIDVAELIKLRDSVKPNVIDGEIVE